MAYRRLYLFVEGPDDERFLKAVFEPQVQAQYQHIQYVRYAVQTTEKIRKFLRSISQMQADYIFFRDFDSGSCITSRKDELARRYRVAHAQVQVVVEEIESWYAAGIADASRVTFGLPKLRDTDTLTKEQFNQAKPSGFVSRIDFMQAILAQYDVAVAARRNRSFAYFWKNYV